VADRIAIEWTAATWNPTTGCDRISAGCDNCYALALARPQAGVRRLDVRPFWRGNDLDLVISAAQSICMAFSASATRVAGGRRCITSAVPHSASPITGLAAGEP